MEEAKSKKRFSSGFSIDSLLENKKDKRSGHDEDIEFHRQISSVEGFQKVNRSLSDSELSENSKAFSLAENELFRQRIVEKKLYEDFIKQKPDVYPTETALLRPSQPTIMRESSILRPTEPSLLRPLEPSLLRPSAEPSLLRPCSYSPPSQHSPTYKDIIPSPPWRSEYDSLPERLSPYREKTSYPRNSIFYNPLHKNRHSAFAAPLSREFPPYRKGLPFVYPGMSFYASKHDFMAYHHHHADMHADPKKCGQVRFSHSQSTELERVFLVQKYISPHERKQIARSLELSERQVKTWFQNRRAKWRRLKIEDEMRTRITGEVVKSDTQF